MEALELQKAEENVVGVRATGVEVNGNAVSDRTATKYYNRQRAQIDSNKIYHDYRWYWVGRRVQDVILSLMALLVLWPFMLVIALIVWIDSPGASPIFKQTRVRCKRVAFEF